MLSVPRHVLPNPQGSFLAVPVEPLALAGGCLEFVFLESDPLIVGLLPVAVIGTYLGTLIATDAFTDEDAQMAAEFSPALERWLPVE